jgi:hypothetical protein
MPVRVGRAPRARAPGGPPGTTSKGPNERERAITVRSSRLDPDVTVDSGASRPPSIRGSRYYRVAPSLKLLPQKRCHGRFRFNLKPADSESAARKGPTKPHSMVCMYTAILWPPAVRALNFRRRVDVARWPLKSPRAAIGWLVTGAIVVPWAVSMIVITKVQVLVHGSNVQSAERCW